MPIEPYTRIPNYFGTKTKIKAIELDQQFNNIVDYLNDEILPVINDLIYNQFKGTDNPALRNAFLINVGDGTTKWDFIKIDNFLYHGLSLIKVERGVDNSVLVSDNDQNYRYITPTENNQVLKSVLGFSPVWGKIVSDCFNDRSILGRHIVPGSIAQINITPDIYAIPDNSIPTIKFSDNCVTSDVLVKGGDDGLGNDKGLTADRLSINVAAVFTTMITSNMMKDSYITTDYNAIFTGVNTYYPILTHGEYVRITDLTHAVYPQSKFELTLNKDCVDTFSLDNVMLNSIDGNRLHYYDNHATNTYLPHDDDLIEDGAIYPEHLTPELRTLLDL